MQRILSLLVFGAGPLPGTNNDLSPWIDARFMRPLDELMKGIEAQEHQRFLKSHLPFDALPYFPEVRYIYLGRDTRDVFMSTWNHYGAYTDFVFELFAAGDPPGGPIGRCPEDIREFWREWITRGSFPWESEGYPFWSHHYHASSYWPFRGLPNLLLVHYNDLLADLEGEMKRVAAFVGIDVAEEDWGALVESARLAGMKRDGAMFLGDMSIAFKGGNDTFLYKGTNGRWRGVLTEHDLMLCERAADRLDPELRRWLEAGSGVVGDPQAGAQSGQAVAGTA